MADNDNDNVFEDGENLQAAIGKALQEDKALLCFVSDDGDESTQWKVALLEHDIREKLQSTTVLLRLVNGSVQTGYLSSVCSIHSVPAIVIIHNAQVVANFQTRETTFDQLQKELNSRYAQSNDSRQTAFPSATDGRVHIELSPRTEGRMRLPNNAYDQFRRLTEQYILGGTTGKTLLGIQLRGLESLSIDVVTAAVKEIRQQFDTITEPTLSDEVTDKLLNTPPSKLLDTTSTKTHPADSRDSPSGSGVRPNMPAPTSAQPPTSTAEQDTARSRLSESIGQSRSPSTSATTPATSQTSQRAQYIAAQKVRETTQAAERARIKDQIAADKAVRREAEAVAATEQRRIDLQNLRKANSTTSDPKASDVRIQVRLFDGATIRNSFPAEATVGKDVRNWIDGEVARKAVSGGTVAGQPYDLKLILTPLPNRTIETGEEDQAISDIDGVRGSATMVMVPVRGYVESYSGSSGGIVGGVVGGATGVVGAGIGLVGSAAGLFVGGISRLLGAGAGAAAAGNTGSSSQSHQQAQGRSIREGEETAATSGSRPNMRVRTLADQRMDEEDERRKKGTQLYNGMGLNVQPRKDEDETK